MARFQRTVHSKIFERGTSPQSTCLDIASAGPWSYLVSTAAHCGSRYLYNLSNRNWVLLRQMSSSPAASASKKLRVDESKETDAVAIRQTLRLVQRANLPVQLENLALSFLCAQDLANLCFYSRGMYQLICSSFESLVHLRLQPTEPLVPLALRLSKQLKRITSDHLLKTSPFRNQIQRAVLRLVRQNAATMESIKVLRVHASGELTLAACACPRLRQLMPWSVLAHSADPAAVLLQLAQSCSQLEVLNLTPLKVSSRSETLQRLALLGAYIAHHRPLAIAFTHVSLGRTVNHVSAHCPRQR
jgi:hypothetical protein